MKHCKKTMCAIFTIIATIIAIGIGCKSILIQTKDNKNKSTYNNCKYVIFFNRYNKDGSNRKNLVFYYDEHMNLIYKENFKAENKVPNQIMINDIIYSYGYGGIFQTNIAEKKTSVLNTETSINIVKYDEVGNVYAYQNYGFEKGNCGKYISKIIKNNIEYIEIDYAIVDFCVCNNILYVTTYDDISMQNGKICIYENQKLIKEYDVNLSNGEGCWSIWKNNVFFLNTNSAYKLEGIEIKKIEFDGIDQELIMPRIVNDSKFNKLYINSFEAQYKDNKICFTDSIFNNSTNYNPQKDIVLDCTFSKKDQILKINETEIKINNSNKYNYVFLSAFEV